MSRTTQRRGPSRLLERGFSLLCLLAAILPVISLAVLLGGVAIAGLERLDWQFLTSYASRHAASAGILAGAVGSLCLVGATAAIAVPVGLATAIYLEEYGRRGRLARWIELNIANLAGVPSIVYGLLGLELFVRALGMGRSLIAGALTLALLVLPIIILTSREALRAVPSELREGALALGASRWQAIRRVVLPMALPGVLTGSILAVSRALGEAAPLLLLGAVGYMDFLPDGLQAPFSALPIQIFDWTTRPQPGFTANAAAGILVLMATLLLLNGVAIVLRGRMQRHT